jgi:hypothetical protein
MIRVALLSTEKLLKIFQVCNRAKCQSGSSCRDRGPNGTGEQARRIAYKQRSLERLKTLAKAAFEAPSIVEIHPKRFAP